MRQTPWRNLWLSRERGWTLPPPCANVEGPSSNGAGRIGNERHEWGARVKTRLQFVIVVLAMVVAGIAPQVARAQESLLDVVLKRDKLIVGTYSTSPPLAYVDDDGKLVGFEIDMAHEIAKDLLGDPNKLEF